MKEFGCCDSNLKLGPTLRNDKGEHIREVCSMTQTHFHKFEKMNPKHSQMDFDIGSWNLIMFQIFVFFRSLERFWKVNNESGHLKIKNTSYGQENDRDSLTI
jgi:hypothetical protein